MMIGPTQTLITSNAIAVPNTINATNAEIPFELTTSKLLSSNETQTGLCRKNAFVLLTPFSESPLGPFGCVLDDLREVMRRVRVHAYRIYQVQSLTLCLVVCFNFFANVSVKS